jgi:hypothetical protein
MNADISGLAKIKRLATQINGGTSFIRIELLETAADVVT